MTARNLLVTGQPGCGKSTLVQGIIQKIHRDLTGFYTAEIRERGRRCGFKIVRLDHEEGILAHEKIKGPVRVGKYGVNIEDLERLAVPSMIPDSEEQIVVVDEIGKMECFSPLFRETLIRTLDSPNPLIGSIALRGGQFIQQIKKRPDVEVILLSENNRDLLVELLTEKLNCMTQR